ncbi:nucleotide sugar dehydrogenase [Corynebacterium qintianiae]|uniref:nucleotide sugar dehydrogenase n=1 Tax=Corynebacterium qintianiae TaxID=2709392 RepID=UPI0013E9E1B0|nr:nucleotide sugar dehydrogenase [Corynebacterium qintianiae]
MPGTVTIVGQGYVGLPLAQGAANAGWKVWGYDTDPSKVASINDGKSPIDDISDEQLEAMQAAGYEASTDPSCIADSDVVVVCVPTPLGEGGSPDLGAVRGATNTASEQIRRGTTFILESTTYPGTTEEICLPILEAGSGLKSGEDFYLAYSPERVNPGMQEYGIKNTPKLVGGMTPEATESAEAFYASFIDTVVPMNGIKEAETAKLLENTFRHVNIALVNEMAKFCRELDIDIWEVIRGAATKPFGFMKFTPGPGVGGHCIPIDPNYLSYEVRKELGYPFRFVELAQEINNSMPYYVVSRVADLLNDEGKALKGAKVLLLGVTYKKDIADQRQSPAVPVAERFLTYGTDLRYHDPYVSRWNVSQDPHDDTVVLHSVDNVEEAVKEADIVVLLQPHTVYDTAQLALQSKVFFDTVGITRGPDAVRL